MVQELLNYNISERLITVFTRLQGQVFNDLDSTRPCVIRDWPLLFQACLKWQNIESV